MINIPNFRWYLRVNNGRFVIGVMQRDGTPIDANTEVRYVATNSPDKYHDEMERIGLGEADALSLCKGVAAELLGIDNINRIDYKMDYEAMKLRLRGKFNVAKSSGSKLRSGRL
jgi:hypothetical protein